MTLDYSCASSMFTTLAANSATTTSVGVTAVLLTYNRMLLPDILRQISLHPASRPIMSPNIVSVGTNGLQYNFAAQRSVVRDVNEAALGGFIASFCLLIIAYGIQTVATRLSRQYWRAIYNLTDHESWGRRIDVVALYSARRRSRANTGEWQYEPHVARVPLSMPVAATAATLAGRASLLSSANRATLHSSFLEAEARLYHSSASAMPVYRHITSNPLAAQISRTAMLRSTANKTEYLSQSSRWHRYGNSIGITASGRHVYMPEHAITAQVGGGITATDKPRPLASYPSRFGVMAAGSSLNGANGRGTGLVQGRSPHSGATVISRRPRPSVGEGPQVSMVNPIVRRR
jgi:hypothetical protein